MALLRVGRGVWPRLALLNTGERFGRLQATLGGQPAVTCWLSLTLPLVTLNLRPSASTHCLKEVLSHLLENSVTLALSLLQCGRYGDGFYGGQ